MVIEYRVDDHIALITIDRPEARNAINAEFAVEMEAAIDRLEDDPDAWVAVIAGNGPAFCAGADLKVVAAGNVRTLYTERGGFGGFVRRDRSKPVIAAVDGPALAGGCELTLACDLVVASERATFGLPEVKRSLVARAGGLTRLPQVMPRNAALELVLTGDPIDAHRARELGLANVVCAPGAALTEAVALARRITANAPLAVRAARRVLLDSLRGSDDDAWQRAHDAFEEIAGTEDYLEGPLAFIEKRPPVWKGR